VRPVENVLRILHDAGLSGREALFALDSMAAFVLGCVSGEIEFQPESSEEQDIGGLASLPPDEFPEVHRLMGELGSEPLDDYSDALFEFGLDLLVQGLFGPADGGE
jgi:hypothetical protein